MAILLASATLLVLFDSLAVATALPSIAADLDLRLGVLQWVVSLYSLSIGSLLLLGGAVADIWGRRRVLTGSLVLAAGAGLLCGLAPSLPLLLTGRVLQGVAAAFAVPATLAAAATCFPAEPWRSRVFSVVAFAATSAGLAGAVLGGTITSTLGWRWLFLITVPLGVIGAVASALLLPADPPVVRRARLDLGGAILAALALVQLIFGLGQIGEGGHVGQAALTAVFGLLLLGGLVVVERGVRNPLVKPRLIHSRRLVGSCLAFFAHCTAYSAVIVVGSLLLQEEHDLSAMSAGLALSPVLIGAIISSMVAAPLLRRFPSRVVVATALALGSASLVGMSLNNEGSVMALLPWLGAWGLTAGPVYVGLTRECIGDAAEEDRGTASALFESMSHIGGAISVAVYLTILGAGLGYHSTQLIGATVTAVAAVLTLFILPRADHDPDANDRTRRVPRIRRVARGPARPTPAERTG